MTSKTWASAEAADLEGRWYWVTDGASVWPAMRDSQAAGGWTNQDTWEDFDGRVTACRLIEEPPAIGTVALEAGQ